MTPTVTVTGLTRRYRDQLALDDISFTIDGPSITGLLGRNGAGKSTLMRVIANQEFASAGSVRVFGASPVENDAILRRMVLVREDQIFPDFKSTTHCGRRRGSIPTGTTTWPSNYCATSIYHSTGRSRSSREACARLWAS
jgi:ABC-type molybdenum transport system ATPase subunit/photorepair protein PhrA